MFQLKLKESRTLQDIANSKQLWSLLVCPPLFSARLYALLLHHAWLCALRCCYAGLHCFLLNAAAALSQPSCRSEHTVSSLQEEADCRVVSCVLHCHGAHLKHHDFLCFFAGCTTQWCCLRTEAHNILLCNELLHQ